MVDKPRIQYVQAPDGARLGAWRAGEGVPMLLAPSYGSHIQIDWDMPELRWYSALAEAFTMISYDRRGGGSSDGGDAGSFETLISDLETVADWSGYPTLVLVGAAQTGPTAIAFAAKHPDRASHLILFETFARGVDFLADPKIQASRALLARDFKAYVETVIFFEQGWAEREKAEEITRYYTSKVTQDGLLKEFAITEATDVTDLMPLVQAKTIIFHRRQSAYPSLDHAREMAAAIPNAELVLLEGEKAFVWDTDSAGMIEGMQRFVGVEPTANAAAKERATPVGGLTEREIEVLQLLAQGQSNKEIAADLSLSVHTIERHLVNIYAKIGARGRTDAAAFAHKNHIA